MRISFFAGLILFALLGCEQYSNPSKKLNAYFDLDSLLDAQIVKLSQNQAVLNKTVLKDGAQESLSISPDTTGWQDEFEILRDFNINLPNNVGSYARLQEGEIVQYAPDAQIDLPVQQFKLNYKDDQLVEITAWLSEHRYIYYTDRRITLNFSDGFLTSYLIEGTQNMIFLDAVDYQISGTITLE